MTVVVLILVVIFFVIYVHDNARGAEQRRENNLIARADEQHAQVLDGDPRGFYGEYPPVNLDQI